MDEKIVQLPGTEKTTSFVAAVKQMLSELPAQIEYHKMRAQIQRTYYVALLEQGFTKEEALHLTSRM